MLRATRLPLFLLALVSTGIEAYPSLAADKEGHFIVHGAGTASCGEWTKSRRNGNWYDMAGWVAGYLTAINEFVYEHGKDVLARTDVTGAEAWLDNYCEEHPLLSLHVATQHLLVDGLKEIAE